MTNRLLMSRTRWTTGLLALHLLCTGGWAWAAKAAQDTAETEQANQVQIERDAERESIQKQRKDIADRRTRDESGCYKKFAVESCLRDVRSQSRSQDMVLRSQELKLNEADRRERAAERLKDIEATEQQQRDKIEAGQDKFDPDKAQTQEQNRAQDRQQRESEAQLRSEQQKARESSHAQSEAKRQASAPSGVERARMKFEAKQQKAAERRARYEKDMADAAKSGKPPAAPLPDSGAPVNP